MEKISYRWADRAVRLLESVQAVDAPKEIQFAASDAVQHFVWATDCRKQSRPKGPVSENYLSGWGAKADKAHYQGKKCFAIAQKWLDQHRAVQQQRALDTTTKQPAAVSEQQVVAAVLQHHTRCGTSLVCQGHAKNAFKD